MEALGTDFTIATPAFPDNQRTVFKGYLFVGDVPLNESGMRDHPLTPMTDANLVRVLQAQCRRKVGLIDYRTVAQGARRDRNAHRRTACRRLLDRDRGRAQQRRPAAPRSRAQGDAAGHRRFGRGDRPAAQLRHPGVGRRRRAAARGRCAGGALGQLLGGHQPAGAGIHRPPAIPTLAIDPLRIAAGKDVAAEALAWAAPLLAQGPVLVYSTAQPQAVKDVQGRLGVEEAGALVERTIAAIARGLVELGVRQLVLAGGETSGACVQALGIAQMQIGPQIDPGVPWCYARSGSGEGLHLALKSGNFGTDDFFAKAFRMLA